MARSPVLAPMTPLATDEPVMELRYRVPNVCCSGRIHAMERAGDLADADVAGGSRWAFIGGAWRGPTTAMSILNQERWGGV